jgi:hypothetical protein
MTEAAAREASGDRSPGVIDALASGKTVRGALPITNTRRTPTERPTHDASPADEESMRRFTQLPKEAGWLLIAAGVVGVVVPGIPGTPFLLAGAVVAVPGGSKLLSRWVGRNPPKIVHSAMRQIGRFIDDLERRYPRR